jgi:hypothetical protein
VLDLEGFAFMERYLVVESLIFLPMFVAGFGCGFYLRDRILKKQCSRYLADPHIVQEVARSSVTKPARVLAVAKPPPVEPKLIHEIVAPKQVPNRDSNLAAPLPPLDFKKIRMSNELRELLSLLPSDERQPPPTPKR